MTTLESQPGGKLLEFEQYIDYQLDRTRSKIRMTDMVTSAIFLVAVALAVLFLEILLDHLFGLPPWLRVAILVVGGSAAIGYGYWGIVRPLLRRVNHYYAARDDRGHRSQLQEQPDHVSRPPPPQAGGSQVDHGRPGEQGRPRPVGDRGRITSSTRRLLTKGVYALAGVIVAVCLYSLLTPKSILDSAGRAFLADIARPTDTRLVNIRPGDDPEKSTVIAGENVPFAVEVQGKRPEAVSLHYSIDGGKTFSTTEMARGKSDFEPWQATLRDVQTRSGAEAVLYQIKGGDAESKTYRLNVRAMPMVVSVTHDLTFPGYIQRERKTAGLPPRPDAAWRAVTSRRSRVRRPPSAPRRISRPGPPDSNLATSTRPARSGRSR